MRVAWPGLTQKKKVVVSFDDYGMLIPSESCPDFRGKLPTRLVGFCDVLHAEALAIDKERIAVMQQSVEDGSSDDIIGEDLAPLFERLVGGDDDGTFFITFGDELGRRAWPSAW